jgi:hypothetical protein
MDDTGLVGKPEGKRPLGDRQRRWENNIKMDCDEAGCRVVDWILNTGGLL